MKTSTEYSAGAKIVGPEKSVELIAKAGFDAWDFTFSGVLNYDSATGRRSVNYDHPLMGKDGIKMVRKLRQIGLDNGIVCNQAHAPFSPIDPEINVTYKRAIEFAAEAGAEHIVFHTMTHESLESNIGLFAAIAPFAEDYGIKIAVENTYLWPRGQEFATPDPVSLPEAMRELLERVNHDYLVACIDTGHAEISSIGTNAPDMIRAAGKKLGCLHIQDCDHVHDSHQLPFTMNVDFEAIVKALREVDYKGDMTLEADSFLYYGYKDRPDEILDGLKIMRDAANRLRDMFFD